MLSDEKYRQLCLQVTSQDQSCIAELYDIYGGALYTCIYNIIRSEDVAVELLQDTFIKIWSKGYTYDPDEGRLYTWMLRIAKNSALNYVNSKTAKQQKKNQTTEKLVYLHDQSREADRHDTMDIHDYIERLDPKYQMILKYIYLRGYTQKEVSEEFNIPLGTVKSRVKIGLRELRKIYDYRLSQVMIVIAVIMKLIS